MWLTQFLSAAGVVGLTGLVDVTKSNVAGHVDVTGRLSVTEFNVADPVSKCSWGCRFDGTSGCGRGYFCDRMWVYDKKKNLVLFSNTSRTH